MGRTRESANLVSDKNIFVDIANDLVGIGTTAPTATLEVSGTLNVSGVSTFNSDIMINATNIGMGNDSAVLHFNDSTNQTRSGYWTNKDGFEIRGDSNSKANVVLQTGNLEIDSNAYIGGILGVNGTLNVSGVSTFQDDVNLGDDDNIILGDGDDLQIYHESSTGDSVIKENGGGNLRLGGTNVEITSPAGSETYASFNTNGSVDLYYDNSKKFETTGAGATVTGITSSTVLYAEGGTFTAAGGGDTETDAALVIKEEGTIYTKDGGNLRVLMEKKSDIIHIGQLGTTLIDGIQLRPGTTGGKVQLHAGSTSGNNLKLETTGGGVNVTGICTATSFSGDGANLTNVPTGFSAINFVLS